MIETKLMRHCLEWLGHLARMQDHRLPNMCLLEWLPQTQPCGGPRRRWRDLAKKDLKAMEIGEDGMMWHRTVESGGVPGVMQNLAEHQVAQQRGWLRGEKNVLCDVCGRRLRRESDKVHHK